ncbi:MAG: sigma-54-dependent Fis family transcriptional regulator [Deltaproteobacteria bacterium]|nr:sigma-54-dependent Fis family transcriptional regulator [Deltaproteobacteria bacterium]MBW1952338.1 sigma-54-dependent Fis family transcriptional regulator [Deltaproteobacteria bacterium]MBW1986529.1 sigma-54-dependent Fis family transcriptional regulator [Deltaproteobacteria bacterium]MBW2135108.1 sigma-54-dependent Fis family transcriptional regulator [Deltaproteobacteria bacterium]
MLIPHKKFNLLVVDDELIIRESLAGWLQRDGYQVETADSGPQALEKIQAKHYDIMLIDVKMPEMDGLTLLQHLKERDPDTAVIMMTAYGSIEDAVEAMKKGAFDYLLKPFDLEELSLTIEKLVQIQTMTMENIVLKERVDKIDRFEELVGLSEPMQKLYETIMDVAQSDATVLITGETGTGKELVARAIHAQSPRGFAPFIAVNCGAFTEQLLESELFGHEKGAFTDAKFTKKGRLELAHGGTLFLDEVGDITMKMQIDLLRVLETHEFTRVGGTIPIHSDFRVIAATHQDLLAAIQEGTFRRDLYYRLNVVHIPVPPLRERRGDIKLLAEHFLVHYAAETNKKIDSIHPDALEAMQHYDWPGNVRELENAIERAVVIGKGRQIQLADLPLFGPSDRTAALGLSLEEMEREHIAQVLEAEGGNISRTAQVLKINRTTLYHKLRKYGLKS